MAKTIDKKKIIEEAVKLGIVNPVKVRNVKIRDEFSELRKKMKYDDAIILLSQKYFLSLSSIESIIYKCKNES